ncbi:MAG TPA: tetratricopeptide repeat protein, partial [Blastocatellia bacterium]|nr:tetratricopeptide repeat protein [Blastocatellia bacterium]
MSPLRPAYKVILMVVILVQGFLSGAQAQGDKDIRVLERGKAIEREITGGEVHTYEFSVSAGQYLYAAVEERGINLIIRLFGPDGKLLIEVDTLATSGPVTEHVPWIAGASGAHRLEVSPRRNNAVKRGYVISMKELRDATAQDSSRVLAEQALLEAQAIEAKAATGELRMEATKKYEKARDLFREIGASDREMWSLSRIGFQYGTLTQYHKALDIFGQQLTLARSLGHRRSEASALFNTAAMYIELGEQQRAIDMYLELLPV